MIIYKHLPLTDRESLHPNKQHVQTRPQDVTKIPKSTILLAQDCHQDLLEARSFPEDELFLSNSTPKNNPKDLDLDHPEDWIILDSC